MKRCAALLLAATLAPDCRPDASPSAAASRSRTLTGSGLPSGASTASVGSVASPSASTNAVRGSPLVAAWGGAELPAAGRCDAARHHWTVAVAYRSRAARARLLQKVPADPIGCEGSAVYYEFSGSELQAMFGRHLALYGVPGAGNSMESCGWFQERTPPDFVAALFASDAKSVDIVTDEKFALYSNLTPCK